MRTLLISIGISLAIISFISFNHAASNSMVIASPLTWQPRGDVVVEKELWIRNSSVLDDPLRTEVIGTSANPEQGAWTFGRMMENMAGDHEVDDFIAHLFQHFEDEQVDINGQMVPHRPKFIEEVILPWRAKSVAAGYDGLAPQFAPMRLNGIVNRIDLRSTTPGDDEFHAGEGRLVYGILSPDGGLTQRTIILEYELVADDCQDVLNWANRWHTLGSIEGTKEYNKALATIVDRFAGKDADPNNTNGSAIITVRTNDETGFSSQDEPWQWREFRMNSQTGLLDQTTVALTPDFQWNNTPLLARFAREYRNQILADDYDIPLVYRGENFLGADSVDGVNGDALEFPFYSLPEDFEARHILSLNTCVGCHGAETPPGTGLLHARPRAKFQDTVISNFLLGGTAKDPVTGEMRYFNELERRKIDFKQLLESTCEEIELMQTYRRVH